MSSESEINIVLQWLTYLFMSMLCITNMHILINISKSNANNKEFCVCVYDFKIGKEVTPINILIPWHHVISTAAAMVQYEGRKKSSISEQIMFH